MIRQALDKIMSDRFCTAEAEYINQFLNGKDSYYGQTISDCPTDTLEDSLYKNLRIVIDEFNLNW